MQDSNRWLIRSAALVAIGLLAVLADNVSAQQKKPNVVVIWGDDIGWSNPSAYHHGMMGYRTPNIDRLAREGARFTDWYGQQSCTAGRSTFITGQSGFRTGLLKVGLPGAKEGMQKEDPTIAGLLKNYGYVTAQYGKNHLGDLDSMLPTAHGFDEFLGNLYHLNAEEEPENPDYPENPEFKKKFGPRGVIKSTADGKITDTGPLTKKRMETIDDEVTTGALDFLERAHQSGKPSFCGGTRHGCTSGRTSSRNRKARQGWESTLMEWSSTMGMLDRFSTSSISWALLTTPS